MVSVRIIIAIVIDERRRSANSIYFTLLEASKMGVGASGMHPTMLACIRSEGEMRKGHSDPSNVAKSPESAVCGGKDGDPPVSQPGHVEGSDGTRETAGSLTRQLPPSDFPSRWWPVAGRVATGWHLPRTFGETSLDID